MPERHPTRQVLASPGFRVFLLARFCRATAGTLLGATLSWHVFSVRGSALDLGMLGIVEFLPVIPAGLVAGAVADAFERLRVLRVARAAVALASAGLLALAGPDAPLFGLFALAFTLSLAAVFEGPAGAALLPSLVSEPLFPPAVTVTAAFRNVGWTSGPVIAGFLIDAGGVSWAYAANLALIVASLVALLVLRTPRQALEGAPVSLTAIREGVAFVRSSEPVLGAMTLDLFAVIFAGATALLPIFATEILAVGPRGFGWLSAAQQLGTVLMAFLLTTRAPILRPGRSLLYAVAAFGLATIAFGLSQSFALSVAALIAAGMADEVSMVARSTLIQLATPDRLRGRVSSVNQIFIGASNELGAAESGFLAALTSATFSVIAGGALCLGALGAVAWRMPGLGRFALPGRAEPR